VVFTAESGVRLQETPGEPPAAWEIDVMIDGEQSHVFIRDLVGETGGMPHHYGLEVQLAVPADTLDGAFERARALANIYLTALALASRAWVRTPRPVVAYEITAGASNREFRQWHRDIPLPLGKTPAPQAAFGSIQERLIAINDPAEAHQVGMAAQFYTAGIREIEPVLRFVLFWPAAEALDGPLRSRLGQTKGDQRHWGVKAFVREHAEDPQLIDDAYALRNDLFHVRPGRTAPQIIDKARDLGDRLEPLLAAAICRCLDAAGAEGALPNERSTAHPIQIVVSATIGGDAATWSVDLHPFVIPRLEVEGKSNSDGSVGGKVHVNYEVQNCAEMRDPSIEVWAPEGPNIGTLELESATLRRASGGEEPMIPGQPDD
jgi:hypothetical protein